MAWESNDIARSIRRYLSMLLADDWTIRIERREVRDEERPVAVVEMGQEQALRARETVPQGEVETLHPITITCYPALPGGEDDDPPADPLREAQGKAAALKTLLNRWLMFGLTVKNDIDGDGKWEMAGPYRLPLWDYGDVALFGEEREVTTDPHDVLAVQRESVNVEAIQDNEDFRRWTVVCEFRVTMEQPGRIRHEDEGYIAEGIEGTYVPPA